MSKFTLEVDRELFQWEKGRTIQIKPQEKLAEIYCVQFYNKKSKVAEEVALEGDRAKIPDTLLTQNIPITAIACGFEGEGTHVLAYKTFRVLPRVKPQSYQEDDEVVFVFGGGASGTT